MHWKTIALAMLLAQSSFFSEVMEVRVTNVDVVVTGRDHKPVSGLKLEDFELYEDGVKKEITNFLEVREDATPSLDTTTATTSVAPAETKAPEDIRRRQIVIFVDNAAVQRAHRNAVLPFVDKFVKQNVRKGDEVALITWEHSLKAVLEPTTDFTAMDAALKTLEQQTSATAGANYRQFQDQILFTIRAYQSSGRMPPWAEAVAQARHYAMEATQTTRQRVEALKIVAASMRGAPGRKILVFVTENLASNPAEAAFAYIDSIKDQFDGYDGPSMNQAHDFEIEGLVRDVADIANSAGVTLYPIDVGGKYAGSDFSDASQARVVTSVATVVTQTASLTVNGLASETGGAALYGATNWQLAFDTISNDLNTYYSLGYRSSGEKQDRLRHIEVRLKNNKRYTVRTRTAVIEPSAASEMNDAVAAHLFRDVGGNDLAIRASAGDAKPADNEAVVIPL
ncbi:MAG TPA: VWA domain-containing protein, partial [Thermoanaerobaculia bacterium]|nr:VWA domain-containing protein [Thermoanaerobaculia bacterium]